MAENKLRTHEFAGFVGTAAQGQRLKRKLYPNVDFYSGIIDQAMGFKPEIFTVLFAIPRTVGWLAR